VKRNVEFTAAAAVLAVLIGCATDDFPTAPPGNGGGGVDSVSFSADIQPIFTINCATSPGCHLGVLGASGLDLKAGTSYMSLVNMMSLQAAPDSLVAAGSAARSYLIAKLEGNQVPLTSPMPIGLPLNPADIQKIRDWIDDGARDN